MADLFPFTPLIDCKEAISWLTDVQRSSTLESPLALRTPRQSLSYRFLLVDQDLARLDGLIRDNPFGDWLVPVWPERTLLETDVLSTDTVVAADTSADYRVGGEVLLIENGGASVISEIQTVGAGSLTLAAAVGTDLIRPAVVPLRTGFAPQGAVIERQHHGLAIASMTFIIRDNLDIPESPFGQYLGHDVLTDPPVSVQPLSAALMQPTVLVDNGFGPIAVEPVRDVLDGRHMVSFLDRMPDEWWNRRKWLHALSGRYGHFWLPSWARELELTGPVLAASNSITVTPVLPNLSDYVGQHIIINDGAFLYREITSAIQSGQNHRLYMTPLGRDVPEAEVGFLRLVRLDADEIEVEYQAASFAAISLPVIEVAA